MKSPFKRSIYYSRSQRRALLTLYLICCSLLAFLIYLRHYRPLAKLDKSKYAALIEEWEREDSLMSLVNAVSDSLFPFDPNKASRSELLELGIPDAVCNVLINYRKAGGGFRKPGDLSSIYGMDTDLFNRLAPWVEISDQELKNYTDPNNSLPELQPIDSLDLNEISRAELEAIGLTTAEVNGIIGFRTKYRKFRSSKDLFEVYNLDSARAAILVPFVALGDLVETNAATPRIELNTCDSLDLIQIKGIGPYRASRIIVYREQLGGYYHLDQLRELPGVDSLQVKEWSAGFTLDKSVIRKMDPNKVSYETLVSHPYIRGSVAKNIIQFREEYRYYRNTSELMNLELIDAVLFSKIANYFSIEIESDN